MATDPVAPSPAARPDPIRNLWQVPALLLGLGAFVSVWQGWVLAGTPGDAFLGDMAALKEEYEKTQPSPKDLKNKLNKVAEGVETSEQAPLGRFYLGSGYVRLAEITPNLDEAHGYWTLARQHFGLVSEKQLSDPADGPRFLFRTAKVQAAVGLPADVSLAEIIRLVRVLSAPPPGEDAGETHRLIADLALRATPPDLKVAKLELTAYLTTGIATPAASLNRGQLRLADLCLRTGESEQARKWLKPLVNDTTAPPDVAIPARALLAQVLMADGNFRFAARAWKELRDMSGVPTSLRLTAAYQLGVCNLKSADFDAAARLFEEAARGEGPETAAARIQLADVRLRDPAPARRQTAVALLADAVKGVRGSAEYDPSLVPLADAQAVFERTVSALLSDGAFEPALETDRAYAAICSPGRDREKRAEILGAWAAALQKEKGGDPKPKFKAAAAEYVALAALQPKTEAKMDLLRRAASFYRQGGDPGTAATQIEEALKLPDIPESVLVPVWVELADALLAANRSDEVWGVFRKITTRDTPLSTSVRYRLARQFVDSRHPGLVPTGRALFEQIANQENVSAAEREFHERALTELAHAQIREGNFTEAEVGLRKQLRIYPYPRAPESGSANLLLGVCLLQRAKDAPPADAKKMRDEALAIFTQIMTDCDKAAEKRGRPATEREKQLADREAWLRLQAALRVLQAYQQMRMPIELLTEAARMRERYQNSVEELIIWSLMYHAFKQLGNTAEALNTRDRMREVFDKLPPSAFPQKTGEYSRDFWLKEWFSPDPK
ncbi:tetratricopeptide repeat protein [Frigoriglobus tundricola]|uniref:Tetratricopeptide repeat protein n=1 Tax=Frigoriglobus tundricola TaxID=2774151 RepID=A0A6M5YTU0_9BACT|nr:hypothetical protein [Frigoriglobus tundricola]QJW96854.1 hypothetical protein FTUN_4414 [Frigoriglobus tundricola]